MEHLEEQTVLDFVSGRLGEPRARVAHEHVDRCDLCRELVALIARDLDSGDTAAGVSPVGPTAVVTELEGPRARRRTAGPPAEQVDEYRIIRLLGRGGMGAVYLARDELLDREVAIKFISLEVAPQHRQRLVVEARAAARIRHPNVVTVYRVGELAGQPYVVYELVTGKTLDALARPAPWLKVLELAVGISRGLAAAHRVGVLHRDIKPSNVMLSDAGEVVLLDFGLAKIAGQEAPTSARSAAAVGLGPARGPVGGAFGSMTATGLRMGTPRYMSPEAWRGEAATPPSDLYSLGVMLYEMCAGRPPHEAGSSEELGRLVTAADPAPLERVAPWVPAGLAAIIDRCLEREPARRFPSAEALQDELEALQMRRAVAAVDGRRARRMPGGGAPYRGEQPFTAEDEAIFFGRRAELGALLERLQRSPFVLLLGDAGVGKSSLCRAGLLPLVAEGALGGPRRWAALTVTPGGRPLAALAAALADHLAASPAQVEELARAAPDELVARFRRGHGPCSAHLVLLDPLDDLVTRADPAEAAVVGRLLGLLARPSPTVRLIATLRTEHLARAAVIPGLAEVIGPAPYILVEPRSEEAVREIILGPARVGGVSFEPPVVEVLVRAATSGGLDLAALERTLAALWRERDPDSGIISAGALAAIGEGRLTPGA